MKWPWPRTRVNRRTIAASKVRRSQRVRQRGKRSGSDRGLIPTTISLTKRSYPVAACTASHRHPQTKLVKVFFRRRMAVSPRAAGNWQGAMLYDDLLEMRITLVSIHTVPAAAGYFRLLDMLSMSIFCHRRESNADPASIRPVHGTCLPTPADEPRDHRAPRRRRADANARVE